MTQFSSSKRLCSWAGLTPGNNQSVARKRLLRQPVYEQPALVQVAHTAVKSTKNAYFKNKYERITKRRGKKEPLLLSPGKS